jgi:hypothetical protein
LRTIIIDHSPLSDALAQRLRHIGFDVLCGELTRDFVELAGTYQPELVLLSLRCAAEKGTEFVRALRSEAPGALLLLLAGMAGSIEGDDHPEDTEIDQILALVRQMATNRQLQCFDPSATAEQSAHAAGRWAEIVARVIECESDPKTILRWSRRIAVSPGALRNWCHTAGVPAKRSLDFARILRAVVRQRPGDRAQDLLDVVDLRTLRSLLKLGRRDGPASGHLPQDVDAFLDQQALVSSDHLLREIRQVLRSGRFAQYSTVASMAATAGPVTTLSEQPFSTEQRPAVPLEDAEIDVLCHYQCRLPL